MTRDSNTTTENTRAVMLETAASLEAAEAVLHHDAEASPDAETTRRLHHLGDQVTAEARNIAGRASRLSRDGDPPG